MKYSISIFFLFSFLIFSFFIHADAFNVPDTSIPRTRLERFFDLDKSGKINAYERGLINTYRVRHWRLARSKAQKKFDLNQNRMLEPQEELAYEKSRQKRLAL